MKTRIRKILIGFALRIEYAVKALTLRQQRLLLFLYCVFCGSVSSVVIADALFPDKIKPVSFFIKPNPISLHVGKNLERAGTGIISDSDYTRLKQIEKCIDSLSVVDPVGFKSFIQTRPHLMDSVHWLENKYLTTKKKK